MNVLIAWVVFTASILLVVGDFGWGVYKVIKSQHCPKCGHLKLLHDDEHGCIAAGSAGCACGKRIEETV